MRGIAPGVSRLRASSLPFCQGCTRREEARSAASPAWDCRVWASDIDPEVLELTKANAGRTGVSENIRVFQADARTIKKPDCRGSIVCNPPYGERMSDITETERLYRDIGRSFAGFSPWHIYILSVSKTSSGYTSARRQVRRLYNGMIPCRLYQFSSAQDK